MSTLTRVEVTETYERGDGSARPGFVRFSMPVDITALDGTLVVAHGFFDVKIDSYGQMSVPLIPTDDPNLSPSGWQYTVTEMLFDSIGEPFLLSVPIALEAVGMSLRGGGSSPSFTVTDFGNGTSGFAGPGVTDVGDGTYTLTQSGVTDAGNGTFAAAA